MTKQQECDGSGTIHIHYDDHPFGNNRPESTAGDTYIPCPGCPRCNGTGVEPENPTPKQRLCDGDGWMFMQRAYHRCPGCPNCRENPTPAGTEERCTHCSGTRENPMLVDEHPAPPFVGNWHSTPIPCPLPFHTPAGAGEERPAKLRRAGSATRKIGGYQPDSTYRRPDPAPDEHSGPWTIHVCNECGEKAHIVDGRYPEKQRCSNPTHHGVTRVQVVPASRLQEAERELEVERAGWPPRSDYAEAIRERDSLRAELARLKGDDAA